MGYVRTFSQEKSMDLHHGTSENNAALLAAGGVDVSLGGGELGQGFYTAEHLWVAKVWSTQKFGARQNNVVTFSIDDHRIQSMIFQIIDALAATFIRTNIRRSGMTRTYRFDVDWVWSPIVGTSSIRSEQHKWESIVAQNALNGQNCTRIVV